MRKGITSIIALFIIFVALVTSYFMSSTYAKYTDVFNGTTATAKVAKWEFNVENNVADLFTASKPFTYDANAFTKCVAAIEGAGSTGFAHCPRFVGTTTDTVVDGKIAPGTAGEYKFKIQNKSDVKFRIAKVAATGTDKTDLSSDGTGSRLYFCLNDKCGKGISGLNALLKAEFEDKTTIYDGQKKVTIGSNKYDAVYTISWYWKFDENQNGADLAVGKYATANADTAIVSLKVTITLDQAAA